MKVTLSTRITDGRFIEQGVDTTIDDLTSPTRELFIHQIRQVLDTKEKAIVRALVELGWTPPISQWTMADVAMPELAKNFLGGLVSAPALVQTTSGEVLIAEYWGGSSYERDEDRDHWWKVRGGDGLRIETWEVVRWTPLPG